MKTIFFLNTLINNSFTTKIGQTGLLVKTPHVAVVDHEAIMENTRRIKEEVNTLVL